MWGFMSEYIMGLGISVRIFKLYEELIYLTLSDNDDGLEYLEKVEKLQDLIDDETEVYDKLDWDSVCTYYDRISSENADEFDAIKSRYYLKIRERYNLGMPFTLDTAIVGKILLEALVETERQILEHYKYEKGNSNENKLDDVEDLYVYHSTNKYSLISSNDFIERIAVNFSFNLLSMPKISFDKIKNNFDCDDSFNEKLNMKLYLLAVSIINTLIESRESYLVNEIYASILNMSQLRIIISYMSEEYLLKLSEYCNSNNIYNYKNGSYVKSLVLTSKRNNM